MVAFHQNKALWALASVASIMTAFYMFRLLFLTFFSDFRGTEQQKSHLHESPSLMTIPLIVLAVLAAIGGVLSIPGNSWLNGYLAPVLSTQSGAHHFGTTEYILMAVAVIGGLVGIFLAYAKYLKKGNVPAEDAQITGFNKVLYNKYYVDEFYTAIIVKPINALSSFFRDFIETGLSAVVFGLGRVTTAISAQGRYFQNGSVGFYLFWFVLGFGAIISYLILAQ